MTKNKYIYGVIALAFFILGAGFVFLLLRGEEDTWLCTSQGWVKHGNPSKPMPADPCGGSNLNVAPPAVDAIINVEQANPASANCLQKGGKLEGRMTEGGQYSICIFADDTRCEEWAYYRDECRPGQNISVFTPSNNAEVALPLIIRGQARVFESTFNYRLKDSTGKIIASGIAMAESREMGEFGDYKITISSLTQLPAGPEVILEILDNSAKDGSEIDLFSVALKLISTATTKVKVYFSNDQLDPEITCTKVFAVERLVPKTAAVGKAALEELLAGPNTTDYQSGYRTNINDGVKLISLKIEEGTATADFSETLQASVGGSCRVGAISAQIRETLMQFPTVKNVVISINGRTEDILQP